MSSTARVGARLQPWCAFSILSSEEIIVSCPRLQMQDTRMCSPGHGALCPCRKPGVRPCRAAGHGEFVVGEMASQPPLPPPLRAVPLAQQQGAQQTCVPACGAGGTKYHRAKRQGKAWLRGHFPYNEFTISRCAAGAHRACARGTMPRAPLRRTGLSHTLSQTIHIPMIYRRATPREF